VKKYHRALADGNFMLLTLIGAFLINLLLQELFDTQTMIPVIAGIAVEMGCDPTVMYFGLLSGATLGGNCTPIGASANITGIGILRKAGYEVKNADFFKIGIPFTLAAIIPPYIYLWIFYGV
jgi:Na+/H+ antiporter NhaD/arsenite permease-like protein